MADEDKGTDDEAPEKSGAAKLVMPIGIAVVLVAIVLGGLHFAGIVSFGGGNAESTADAAEEAAKPKTSGPAFYAALRPAMIVNFTNGTKRHFLKVAIDIMSHEQPTIEAFKQHDAIIRNNLLILFQDIDFDKASTREGIEELQAAAEKEIEDILEPYVHGRDVEGVYFTTFVLQ